MQEKIKIGDAVSIKITRGTPVIPEDNQTEPVEEEKENVEENT